MATPEDADEGGVVRVLVGIPRSILNILTSRTGGDVRFHFLFASNDRLELNDLNGRQVRESYAEFASSYDRVTLLTFPYCHIPDRVKETLDLMSEFGAKVLRPSGGEGLWPPISDARGPGFDDACVSAVCRAVGLVPHFPSCTTVAPLVVRERATMLSMLKGLASHDKVVGLAMHDKQCPRSVARRPRVDNHRRMACRNEHDVYGMAAGAAIALLHAGLTRGRLHARDVLLIGAGGALGGLVGSRLPDVLEPPTSSWHRSTAHSAVATGAVAYVGARHAAPLASRLHEAAESADDGIAHAASRFLAAAAIAAPAGYVSHTLADAQTPRGIPLLTRGL